MSSISLSRDDDLALEKPGSGKSHSPVDPAKTRPVVYPGSAHLEDPTFDYQPSFTPHDRDRTHASEGSSDNRDTVEEKLREKVLIIGGKYELLDLIGEGGMGSVYRAQQISPGVTERIVAVKLIKSGMEDHRILDRFMAERTALSLMDDPQIARIFDAGYTDLGLPYFVMEYFPGSPITEFCDIHRISLKERVELAIKVCKAIQHAHHKGIIHRDIKPGNILAVWKESRPEIKVIDFGVAKAIDRHGMGEFASISPKTAHGAIIGTPEYMSPEQASFGKWDTDTRSDVYSLGVLLYELVSGAKPIDSRETESKDKKDIFYRIREVDPPLPSAKVAAHPKLEMIAGFRRETPKSLPVHVQGDLDWIIMKALDKDPNRRYQTPGALAEDLDRFLANEIVEAGPPSKLYRFKKFVKRNRTWLGVASVVFVLLLGGVVSTSLALLEAINQEKELKAKRDYSRRLLNQMVNSHQILTTLFQDLSPARLDGDGQSSTDIPLADILGERLKVAASQLNQDTVTDPLTAARLRKTIGESEIGLGHPGPASELLAQAAPILREILGPENPETMDCNYFLAKTLDSLGRYDQARPLHIATLNRRSRIFGLEHPDTLRSMNNFAFHQMAIGDFETALETYKETLELREKVLGENDPDTLETRNQMGALSLARGNPVQAKTDLEVLLAREKELFGMNHPMTQGTLNLLGLTHMAIGNYRAALDLLELTQRLRSEILGPSHPDTLGTMHDLASVHLAMGKYQKCFALLEEVLSKRNQVFGFTHPETLHSRNLLGQWYLVAGQVKAGRKELESVFLSRQKLLGDFNPETLKSMLLLGKSFLLEGKNEQGIELLSKGLDSYRGRLGADHPDTLLAMDLFGFALNRSGKYSSAKTNHQEALERISKKMGPDHPLGMAARDHLAHDYQRMLRIDEAGKLFEVNLKKRQEFLGPEHPEALESMNHLALCYRDWGQSEKAVSLLEKTIGLRKEVLKPNHPDIYRTMNDLATTYQKMGLNERAELLFIETLRQRKEILGPTNPDTWDSLYLLGAFYLTTKKEKQALPFLEEAYGFQKQFLGTDHEETLKSLEKMGECYLAQGALNLSLPLLTEVVEKRKATLGSQDPYTLLAMDNLGKAFIDAGDFPKAEALLRMALSIRDGMQQAHESRASTMAFLGGALLGMKKYSEAEKWLGDSLAGVGSTGTIRPENEISYQREARKWLERLHKETGFTEKKKPGPNPTISQPRETTKGPPRP